MYKILIFFIFCSRLAYSQAVAVKADRLITGNKELLNPTIVVQDGKIFDITFERTLPDTVRLIDLTGYTLLPGLIDVHTHILHDGGDYEKNLYGLSTAFKAVRAVSHLDISLKNGFTTLRDVGTEGAGYADVDLARGVESKLIQGPTIIPATTGIATTGQYYPDPSRQNWELELPSGTTYVSGVDECRRAVRDQIARGAKWIKVFADWSAVSFTEAELRAVVEEAKRHKVNVAAHATTREGISLAMRCGARSIEHGDGFDKGLIEEAIKSDVYWCPTITVYEHYGLASVNKYEVLNEAYRKGLKIVLGTDAGAFPWTINQAKELEYFVKLVGMRPIDAIRSATVIPADLLGKQLEIGQLEKGFNADIIAVKGNPLDDISLLQQTGFVMKGGFIVKLPN